MTYGDAYQLPENYFSAMNTSLNLGLFAQSVVTQNPEQTYDELLAIGDYKNCIIKVRLSIPTPMNAQYGDGDPYRLFYGLSKFMFIQLANNAVNQP